MAGVIKTFLLKLVLESAIEAEENAYNFYEQAIAVVNKPGPKRVLRTLASEELKHRLKLEEMQREANLGRFQVTEQDHVDTIEQISIEWPPITGGSSTRDLLEIALEKEKYATAFYALLRDKSSIKTIKETFDVLASEEKRHVDWVSNELASTELASDTSTSGEPAPGDSVADDPGSDEATSGRSSFNKPASGKPDFDDSASNEIDKDQ